MNEIHVPFWNLSFNHCFYLAVGDEQFAPALEHKFKGIHYLVQLNKHLSGLSLLVHQPYAFIIIRSKT